MALNYFYGYLKLLMEEFEGTIERAFGGEFSQDGRAYKDLLSSKKLFIIMPMDCQCSDRLQDEDPRITFVGDMPKQVKARGGIRNRVYKNNMMRIKVEGEEPKYLLLEYATPLLSLHEAYSSREISDDLSQHVICFYDNVKRFVEKDPKCKANVVLLLRKSCLSLVDTIMKHLD